MPQGFFLWLQTSHLNSSASTSLQVTSKKNSYVLCVVNVHKEFLTVASYIRDLVIGILMQEWRTQEKREEAVETPQVVLVILVFHKQFHSNFKTNPFRLVQGSLRCASVSHLSHGDDRQYSFFVSIFQSAFQGVFFLLWCMYTKTNALLNPEVLKIKCRAIPQVVFFTHKQLYLVMEDSRQECIWKEGC